MAKKKRYTMPRPRKYDYQKDYPVRLRIHIKLPVEVANELENLGYDHDKMSKEVERIFTELVENSRKKDS